MIKFLLPLLPLALVAQSPAPPVPRPSPSMPPGMARVPGADTPEPKDSDPIAYLGQKPILYSDFLAWLKVMAGPRTESVRRMSASRAQAMKQYLDLTVLAARAQKLKLQNTKEYKTALDVFRQRCYAMILLDEDRPGSDGQKMKQEAENPTEDEVRAYFNANSERYATPEKFTARHILVSLKGAPNSGGKGLTEDEAKAKLAKIHEELKAGRKFEDLAKEYSDDPGSKANGGLYKDMPFGRFAKEFEAAVRTQEIGKVGDPVKTPFGYHLIEVESRTPKQGADFEKVKDAVRRQMIPERREKLNKEYMERVQREVGFKEVPAPPKPAAPPAPAPATPAAPVPATPAPAAP